MQGFLFVMLVSNLLTSLLNLHRLLHVTGLRVQWLRWVIKTGVLVFVCGRGVPVRAAAADAAAGPAASGLGCFGSGIHQRYLRAVHLAYRLRRAGRLYRQAHRKKAGERDSSV